MPTTPDHLLSLPALRPAIAAGVLAILWIIESVAPMFSARSRRVSHGASNLALALINAAVTAVFFASALLYVTQWAGERSFGLLNWLDPPTWLRWVLAIVLFDAWMYVWHVLNHKVPFLWRFHAVHHADRELDASSAVRFHTGEIVLSSIARLAVLPLLGMTLPQLLLYETLSLPVILFHHSNVRMPRHVDTVLRCVIVTPWMHWVHHSRLQPETDSNYASFFSWWDRLFRTFRLRDDPTKIELGLDDEGDETNESRWRSLWGMLLRPLGRMR